MFDKLKSGFKEYMYNEHGIGKPVDRNYNEISYNEESFSDPNYFETQVKEQIRNHPSVFAIHSLSDIDEYQDRLQAGDIVFCIDTVQNYIYDGNNLIMIQTADPNQPLL